MLESGVGFSTSVTRQCSGIDCGGGALVPPGPDPAGGVKSPSGIVAAAGDASALELDAFELLARHVETCGQRSDQ